jgi:alginate O-acetyltransferase complex protein AlgJ
MLLGDMVCLTHKISDISGLLDKKGIKLAIVMVPIKMRIYEEYLPDGLKLNEYMITNYDRMGASLAALGITTIDLNTPFLKSPERASDTPLYFKLDSHWSSTGAILAAQTVGSAISSDPTIKSTINNVPTQGYKMTVGKFKRQSKARDILRTLPADSPANQYAYDRFFPVTVSKIDAPSDDLLGKQAEFGIALVGSSYSIEWTGFVDALRFNLQKNIFSMGVGANQGSWVGMESYLKDDAFQQHPPKLLIWEIPERDMAAPPDFKYREARYQMNNTEWLNRVSALINNAAKPLGLS